MLPSDAPVNVRSPQGGKRSISCVSALGPPGVARSIRRRSPPGASWSTTCRRALALRTAVDSEGSTACCRPYEALPRATPELGSPPLPGVREVGPAGVHAPGDENWEEEDPCGLLQSEKKNLIGIRYLLPYSPCAFGTNRARPTTREWGQLEYAPARRGYPGMTSISRRRSRSLLSSLHAGQFSLPWRPRHGDHLNIRNGRGKPASRAGMRGGASWSKLVGPPGVQWGQLE